MLHSSNTVAHKLCIHVRIRCIWFLPDNLKCVHNWMRSVSATVLKHTPLFGANGRVRSSLKLQSQEIAEINSGTGLWCWTSEGRRIVCLLVGSLCWSGRQELQFVRFKMRKEFHFPFPSARCTQQSQQPRLDREDERTTPCGTYCAGRE
jgi:hypothetical protein